MGTNLVDDADAAFRIAKRDQILAQQPQPQLDAIGSRKLVGNQRGSQYRRMRSPIGVPGPVRVRSSLSSSLIMARSTASTVEGKPHGMRECAANRPANKIAVPLESSIKLALD